CKHWMLMTTGRREIIAFLVLVLVAATCAIVFGSPDSKAVQPVIADHDKQAASEVAFTSFDRKLLRASRSAHRTVPKPVAPRPKAITPPKPHKAVTVPSKPVKPPS